MKKIRNILRSDLVVSGKVRYFLHALIRRFHSGACHYALRGGMSVTLRAGTTDEKVFDEVFIEQAYAPYTAQVTPLVLIDLGANIGLSAIFLLRAFPAARMVAVEPDRANFAMLLENLRSAGLENRCIALRAFVGAERGFAQIEDSGNGAWGMRMGTPSRSGIPVIPLVDLMGAGQKVVVKCDIEGAERQLFSRITDWEHRVEFMILELHADLFPVEQFLRLLQSSRYDWTIHGKIRENSCISVIGLERKGSRRDAETRHEIGLPFVSVIIPCRNEARFLSQCLDSILNGDYPADRMEVIVADGMSDDGTRELIARYTHRDARVRLVDNPKRITPVALNCGINIARGEIIARIDAHAEMAPDYLSRCVESLARTGADNVGGTRLELAQDAGVFSGPIIAALTHPFGVGNAHYRFGGRQARWVDTVFGGCWRRDVFERIGKFNEQLPRSQDLEFNQRLRKAGGKILYVPELTTSYYTRSRLGAFCRHNWTNGVWAILPFAYSDVMPVRWRHLAPLGLVVALIFLGVAAAVPYAVLNLGASIHLAVRNRNWSFVALMPLTFGCLHVAYGTGSLWGVARLAAIGVKRILS